MSRHLTERNLDVLLYVLDIWMNDNEDTPLHKEVEALYESLSRCNGVTIKSDPSMGVEK
jgi:hypothetical protein